MPDDTMVVKSLMRSEILDDATCEICEPLDGIVLPADDPAWAGPLGMPAHCNCRFDLIAIFDGIDPVLEPTPHDEIVKLIPRLGALQTASSLAGMKIPTTGANRFVARKLRIEDIEDLLEPADLIVELFGVE